MSVCGSQNSLFLYSRNFVISPVETFHIQGIWMFLLCQGTFEKGRKARRLEGWKVRLNVCLNVTKVHISKSIGTFLWREMLMMMGPAALPPPQWWQPPIAGLASHRSTQVWSSWLCWLLDYGNDDDYVIVSTTMMVTMMLIQWQNQRVCGILGRLK